MSHDSTAFLGGIAAFLASLSYFPQVRKAWPRGSTADLSLGMLVALTTGLALWVAYGAMGTDSPLRVHHTSFSVGSIGY
jgi:MtN3 and saliva related transmembrane protein